MILSTAIQETEARVKSLRNHNKINKTIKKRGLNKIKCNAKKPQPKINQIRTKIKVMKINQHLKLKPNKSRLNQRKH